MPEQQDNTAQKDLWNGLTGASWYENQAALDQWLAPVAAKLMAASGFAPGQRVLDVGCGTGATTIEIAKRVAPGGHATGLDISAPLLEGARNKARGLNLPISWIEADASAYAFGTTYDRIVSRFGVMFFADPFGAFSHLKSALAPGGEMVFICWRRFNENPWTFDLMMEVGKIVPLPPRTTDYAPGPFAFGEKTFLESVLDRAGFKRRSLEVFDLTLTIPGKSPEDWASFYERVSPTAALIREAPDDKRAELKRMLRNWMASPKGGAEQKASCWLVRAS